MIGNQFSDYSGEMGGAKTNEHDDDDDDMETDMQNVGNGEHEEAKEAETQMEVDEATQLETPPADGESMPTESGLNADDSVSVEATGVDKNETPL